MHVTGMIRSTPGRLLPGLLLLCLVSTPKSATEPERTGGWRLALESSPYLRMHADNPVEWFPWGEAAFEQARRENRPLFISIGYFTCHWCHVMARESFSDPEIAGLLNAGFVAVKIDREQRPDLDDVYMSYVQATRGQGGWPLSVWATPDGKPFFGGSYFPPADERGHPGMKRLLNTIRTAWQQDRAGVEATAGNAVKMLQNLASSAEPLDTLTTAPLVRAREQIARAYDELSGGFGEAPRFPQPARLLFLLQDSEPSSAGMALRTLDAMAAGGIHDQLGGGFHRYATDAEWRVPHFEQMLYDQALVARAYLQAFRRTDDERHAGIARGVLDFTLAALRDPAGGFYSALSADSPLAGDAPAQMQEGAYYTWSLEQLGQALQDPVLLEWAAARYGATEHGEAHGEVAGSNVLHRALDDRALMQRFGVDAATATRRNAAVDERLRRARERRPAVPVDDKVVTAWNGYMITTLAQAGRILDEPRYIDAAAATAGFVLEALQDNRGVLYRDWRQGQLGVPAFAEDYAALAEGLLALHEVTGEARWLQPARQLVDTLLARFRDAEHGGFYSTAAGTELWVREKNASDGVTLSVNGLAVHVLLQLADATGQREYREQAVRTAAWAGAQLADAPAFMPYTLIRWPELLQITAAGNGDPGG